jgi:hypothetical protein
MLTTLTAPSPQPAPGRVPDASQALLRNAREGTIVLRGPSSGQLYRFSSHTATAVRAGDVSALLRTGLLKRANQ